MTNRLSDSGAIGFDVLTKDNYRSWRMKAEALLRVSDLWDHVDEDEKSSAVGESWMKKDGIAKSKLILHISSELLLLLENCATAREVWLKLENVYDNRDKDSEVSTDDCEDNDEDVIINAIEDSAEDFFNKINDLSGKNLMDYKELLSSTFTNGLFSRLKKNNAGNSRDKEKIVNTVNDFIAVIGKLSNIEIKKQQNELVSKLIDTLLVIFDIEPHKNHNDEAKSDADAAEIPYDNMNGDKKIKKDGMMGQEISSQASDNTNTELFGDDKTDNETEAEAETETRNVLEKLADIWRKMLQSKEQVDHEEFPCELENRDSIRSVMDSHTPPPTPSLEKTRECEVCREEGHNRTTCPMNKPAASESIIQPSKVTESPKRSYKCGVCREEGHNRTTCPMNKPAASESIIQPSKVTESPKRSYKCGVCREEGHNRTTCPMNKPAASESIIQPSKVTESPKRSYKCGVCREEGHNRTTCPMNKPAASESIIQPSKVTESPKRSYKCGVCREEGHNRTTCPMNKPAASESIIQPSKVTESPKRSYKCGVCREEGHNSTTCPMNKSTASQSVIQAFRATESPKRSYKCGICREEGHNRTTCPMNGSSKPAASSTSARSYGSELFGGEEHNRSTRSHDSVTYRASTRATPRCSTCGGEGHNSRTCGRRSTSSSSYNYMFTPSPPMSYSGGGRSYTCGNCGGSGHNRRTCPY
ncbi:uncharacterized protein LOC124301254 isoform X2 [Neodiprion virginianus]|uniref:uncharacterized protein LOC124301254 isoform X2 n=1 Tax=Neodiprion virginianus TaxID=2961670 RepID=UPI001EE74372|nr:uncharacterized protein LOC124301254 isoform X2 [Neodiprion virginianus]